MKKGFLLLLGIVVIVLAWVLIINRAEIISADTVIEGDYTVSSPLRLKDGVQLTVNGNFTLNDEIECIDGPLRITVNGDAMINGTLQCVREGEEGDPSGIQLVVSGELEFSKDSVVASNSDIEIVSSEEALILTEEAKDELFEETGTDSGDGPRLGPLSEEGVVNVTETENESKDQTVKSATPLKFVQTAQAQGEPRDKDANVVRNVILRGNWYVGDGGTPPGGLNIPEPPKGVKKVILNFNFGDDGNVNLEDFYLIGPDGRAGEDDSGSCSATGKKGEDGFRMRVKAANVTLNSFTLELGDGGSGGMAETSKDCENGVATGGDGGQASNFKITAVGKIEINSFKLFPGMGGAGGEAIAYGKDGAASCPGEKGGDATATGGNGGVNKKSLTALGAVSGISNVEIDTVLGGGGGEASATPGKGGAGDKCGCTGGQGGSGTATGGKGGDASATAPVPVTSQGGDGGNAELRGGEGGVGGSCGPENQGGAGGAGGSASAKAGIAGTGQSSNGTDGTIKDQTGGNGGKGGDGCEEGAGGAGGSGDPDGEKGADGENLCAAEKEEGGGVDIRKPETSTETLDVIEYNGKFLPVSQLIIESESGCDGGQAHWHAAVGVVTATDGSQVADPGPQCGYGKTKDKPVKKIELKAEASSGQTQAEVFFDGEFR